MSKKVKILSFHSQKGGVGKSTLSLYSAIRLNQEGQKVYILDLDLTGSSLRDLDKFFQNKNAKSLNDYLLCNPFRKKTIDPLKDCLITFKRDNGINSSIKVGRSLDLDQIFLLSNSSKYEDICKILPFIYKEFDLKHLYFKISDLIDEIIEQNNEEHISIIIDNSPGFWGISKTVYDLLVDKSNQINYKSVLVTTTDKQDYSTLLDCFDKISKSNNNNYLVFNKTNINEYKALKEKGSSYIKNLLDQEYNNKISFIPINDFMGTIFKYANQDLNKDIIEKCNIFDELILDILDI